VLVQPARDHCEGVIPPRRQGVSSSVGPASVRPDKPDVLREVPTPALDAKRRALHISMATLIGCLGLALRRTANPGTRLPPTAIASRSSARLAWLISVGRSSWAAGARSCRRPASPDRSRTVGWAPLVPGFSARSHRKSPTYVRAKRNSLINCVDRIHRAVGCVFLTLADLDHREPWQPRVDCLPGNIAQACWLVETRLRGSPAPCAPRASPALLSPTP
jgi:hypothetical protein